MENLFSYGTLQQKNVQIENYSRILSGSADILQEYCLNKIEIKDLIVLRKSSEKFHPIIFYTGNICDEVSGMVFQVTAEELVITDSYEVDDYMRIRVTLKSGIKSWVYIGYK